MLNMCKALSLIPGTTKRKKEKNNFISYLYHNFISYKTYTDRKHNNVVTPYFFLFFSSITVTLTPLIYLFIQLQFCRYLLYT
jgi:hypothetical protein